MSRGQMVKHVLSPYTDTFESFLQAAARRRPSRVLAEFRYGRNGLDQRPIYWRGWSSVTDVLVHLIGVASVDRSAMRGLARDSVSKP
jgi:hypothetical protein